MVAFLRRHSLIVFFVLAFLLSWWTWPFVLLNPRSAPVLHFGVLFAAFITAAIVGGGSGVRSLFTQIVHWRVRPVWYAVALLLPIAAVAATSVLASALGARLVSGSLLLDGVIALPIALITTTLFAGPLSEEPGWRGTALPRMIERLGVIAASLLLGLIWALWHLPLLLTDPTRQREPIPFILTLTFVSLALTWVYLSTGRSLLLVILMHGMFNTIAAVVFPAFDPSSRVLIWWVLTVVWFGIGLLVATRLQGGTTRQIGRSKGPPREAGAAS